MTTTAPEPSLPAPTTWLTSNIKSTIPEGRHEMHPILLSLENIDASVRMKASSRSFALTGHPPIPKFLHVPPQVSSIINARVYRSCISDIMQNLKDAEKNRCFMTGPDGYERAIHTTLVSWIADSPEQLLLACTAGQQPWHPGWQDLDL